MRANYSLLALILIVCPLSVGAQGAWQLGESLKDLTGYHRDATFEVLLPSAEDPVTYDVNLQSDRTEPSDTLSPCDYVISWKTIGPMGALEGFSAYFDGNHYRYRNNRLQEYHIADNPTVFAPQGAGSQYRYGVHATAQFADMLPQFLGLKMQEIAADTAYRYAYHPDTLVSGKRRIVVDGVKRSAGYDVAEFAYVFDKETFLPVAIELVNSPGSISEQVVSIRYSDSSESPDMFITEEGLIDRWPEEFEKFRESSFRTENLVGKPLPAFSCQVLGSQDRYTHHAGEPLSSPAIIAVIDTDVATAEGTVAAVRDALSMLPMSIDVLWALKTNNEGEAQALLSPLGSDETAFMSAGSLIRNAGITLFPTIILCQSDGKVADVIAGYNKELGEVVIQKAALLK